MNPSIPSANATPTALPLQVKVNKAANQKARKMWLICGILSPLLYVAMDICASMLYKDYSSFSQTVSELSAIGAPTRPLWVGMAIAFTLLMMAFGWGVW